MENQCPRPSIPSPFDPSTAVSAAERTSFAGSPGFGEKSVRKLVPVGKKPFADGVGGR